MSVSTETDSRPVTPQNVAKIVESIPAEMPGTHLHDLVSSGILADVLSADPESVKHLDSSSLWRDRHRRLLGLKPKSIRFTFATSESSYREMAGSIRVARKFPPRSFGDALLSAIGNPVDLSEVAKDHLVASLPAYEARQRLTAVSFAPGMNIRSIAATLREFRCEPATLRSYIKFLAYLWKQEEYELPEGMRGAIFVGGFAENVMRYEGVAKSFIWARRTRASSSKDPASCVQTWHNRYVSTLTRTWVLIETDSYRP